MLKMYRLICSVLVIFTTFADMKRWIFLMLLSNNKKIHFFIDTNVVKITNTLQINRYIFNTPFLVRKKKSSVARFHTSDTFGSQ